MSTQLDPTVVNWRLALGNAIQLTPYIWLVMAIIHWIWHPATTLGALVLAPICALVIEFGKELRRSGVERDRKS